HDHRGARGGQLLRDPGADALRRAGHDRHLALQLAHDAPPFCIYSLRRLDNRLRKQRAALARLESLRPSCDWDAEVGNRADVFGTSTDVTGLRAAAIGPSPQHAPAWRLRRTAADA